MYRVAEKRSLATVNQKRFAIIADRFSKLGSHAQTTVTVSAIVFKTAGSIKVIRGRVHAPNSQTRSNI